MAKKRTRAANGMGTVRQRKDGTWEGRYTAPDGRQKSVYAKTEADVTKKLRGVLHELDSGAWVEPSKMTVSQWFDIWLTDYQAHTTIRTQRIYADLARLHISPIIGTIKIAKLLPMHVRRVVNAMVEKGLSPNYVHHAHGVMSSAFNAAMEAGVIKSNPAKGVKTPRVVKREYNIVDRDIIPAFIDAAGEDTTGNALIFLLLTGLRAAELRGLQWSDIDLDAATMSVARQIPCKGHPEFVPPKDGSARVVQLPVDAVNILRKQRKEQAEARLAAGADWEKGPLVDDLVFRTPRGHFVSESVLHKSVRAVGEKIGLPNLHPHDLRHSYAVAALRSGIDVKTVQHNLGHKNASMTLDVYAAYTTDAGKRGAEKLGEYWQDALKK